MRILPGHRHCFVSSFVFQESKFVVDIMTAGPVLIGPETNAASAEHLSSIRGVHHLLVVDGYKLVGVVCPCDLYTASAWARVSDFMHSRPFTIDDQETATEAWKIMRESGVGCLPVVDWTGALRGVVTRRDLTKAGVVSVSSLQHCTACGSTHGLRGRTEDGVLFCVRCLDQCRQPRSDLEEEFFTLGGGD